MTTDMGPYEAYLADMEPCLSVIRSYADDDTANQLDFHRAIEWAFMKGATAWMLMESAHMSLDEVIVVLKSHPDKIVV